MRSPHRRMLRRSSSPLLLQKEIASWAMRKRSARLPRIHRWLGDAIFGGQRLQYLSKGSTYIDSISPALSMYRMDARNVLGGSMYTCTYQGIVQTAWPANTMST